MAPLVSSRRRESTSGHPLRVVLAMTTRALTVLCTLLVLVALSVGSVGGARTGAHAHPPAAAQDHLSGSAGSSVPATQGHGHPEPGPQTSRQALALQVGARATRRHLRNVRAAAHQQLLVLLRALRPRSSLPAAAPRTHLTARPPLALFCVYRI